MAVFFNPFTGNLDFIPASFGLPAGGTVGQVLTKDGSADYETAWAVGVLSDVTGITGADPITNMVALSQAEYDAIATPDPATFYVIV